VKQLALLIVVLLSVLVPTQLNAETRYVSDSLTIFIRTGPSHQFRIVGTIKAGDAVEFIADDAINKATHVRLSTGREVWVDTEQLMSGKPSSLLLSEVSSKLQQSSNVSNQKISDLRQDLKQANELASVSKALQEQVTQLEYDKELLDQKNQTLSDRSRYDLMTAGGIVALIGVLLGLVLPHFFRRKKNDVWR
jgi:SH3 domain protein